VASFTSRPVYAGFPLVRPLGGPQSRSGRCEDKNLATPGIRTPACSPSLYRLITKITCLKTTSKNKRNVNALEFCSHLNVTELKYQLKERTDKSLSYFRSSCSCCCVCFSEWYSVAGTLSSDETETLLTQYSQRQTSRYIRCTSSLPNTGQKREMYFQAKIRVRKRVLSQNQHIDKRSVHKVIFYQANSSSSRMRSSSPTRSIADTGVKYALI
jgi:hypothetical protein